MRIAVVAAALWAAGASCSSKVSSDCPGGQTRCGASCADVSSDARNCGSCGSACGEGQACTAGACGLGCSGGTTACGDKCIDTKLDPANCGACTKACAAGELCSAGKCASACGAGATACSGKCVDTKLDPANCGGCAKPCPTGQLCSVGSCGLTCAGGTTNCGGKCADTQLDPANCGGCGKPCAAGQVCAMGACGCAAGTTLCGAQCVDTQLDPANCGMCKKACDKLGSCVKGGCVSCTDKIKNGTETDVDCGGACKPCAGGKACGGNGDCQSSSCVGGKCAGFGIVQFAMGRRWADGSYAAACYEYINSPDAQHAYTGSTGDGRYTVDPDGPNGIAPFDVYCDMTTDNGGWTLIDNDADTNAAFTTRQPGANPDVTVTRGSYLPLYSWSAAPQLLCQSSQFTGAQPWVTLDALGNNALEYPTKTTVVDATYSGEWATHTLNGNTDQGTTAWIYSGSGRFGSVWIGNGGQPTCACDYYAPSPQTGLGSYTGGVATTCSTWVR